MSKIALTVLCLLSLAQIFSGQQAEILSGQHAAFGLAALAVAGTILLVSGRGVAVLRLPEPVSVRALSLRRRAAGLAFLRLRDPDAAGRTRPRAPTTVVTH